MALGTIIGTGANLLGSLFGLSQTARANRLERNNPLPITQVNQNILANQLQARQMAQVGLAQEQYNQALQQQQNNLSNVLSSASRTGRNIPVAGILRQANQATQNLNVQDAMARQTNQRLLMQQNQNLANEQLRVWNWNKAQPYLRTAQQVASMRNAGIQNIFGGIGGITQMALGGAYDDSDGGQTQGINPYSFNQRLSQFGTPYYGTGGRLS